MKIRQLFRRLFRRDRPANVNLEYPTAWETMTYQQFRDVAYILALPGISREKALLLCLCKLTGIAPENPAKYDARKIKGMMPFIINGQAHLIKASDIAAACHELGFIYDSVGLPPAPMPKMDRMLYDINFRQFFAADSFMLRSAADAENARRWVKEAVKIVTNGRIRKLNDTDRMAFVIWWNGVKDALRKRYPFVFQEGSGFSDKTQAEILQDLLSCMNDNRPQENDNILKAPAHDVLYSLNKIYQDAHERNNK